MSDILDLEDGAIVEVITNEGVFKKKKVKYVGYFEKPSKSKFIKFLDKILGWDFTIWFNSMKDCGVSISLDEVLEWHELDYAGDEE